MKDLNTVRLYGMNWMVFGTWNQWTSELGAGYERNDTVDLCTSVVGQGKSEKKLILLSIPMKECLAPVRLPRLEGALVG